MSAMNTIKKAAMAGMITATLGGSLLAPMAARASEAGRRNTTLGLGALTAVLAAKGQWVPAAIAGVGTVAAEHNWQAQINARHRRDNWFERTFNRRHR